MMNRRGYQPLGDIERLIGSTRTVKSDEEAFYLGQISGYKERATLDLLLSRADWVRQRVKGRPGH